ncbi:uncharacterized protein LOC105012196 isoform X2 [Esox lucius]|uniref:uncharacterized protein LOC105012196 isoform X2 n=1 Tax=Esox lucius TaxID=8010 RepID=UPI00147707A4|nr:uncharacterized protein LOC105012196 isoform X2 [Esox lucius]
MCTALRSCFPPPQHNRHDHTVHWLLSLVKMLVGRYHLSLWTLTVVTGCLRLWGTVSSDSIPAPSLIVVSSVGKNTQGPVSLVCRAPEGHGGTLFRLNRFEELVDTRTFPTERREAHFTLQMTTYSAQDDLYCCLYQSQGTYSLFSPYVSLIQRGVSSSLPPPLLSVQPPGGQVKHGQTLSFDCSLAPSQQSVEPEAFLLLRTARVTRGSMVHPESLLVFRSTARARAGAFSLEPVRSQDGGSYTCLYQVAMPQQGLVNSTASPPVQVVVTEVLPPPTLSLDNQTGGGVLVCTGSPSYPGARFSLYRLGSVHPEATRDAPAIRHRALFALSSLPPREDPMSDQFQCQYSALLGTEWSHSERTEPLAVSTVTEKNSESPPLLPGPIYMDWPLVLGSLSALVLFLIILVVLSVAVKRKVKATVEKKRRRDAALLWTKLQSRDHIVDLTLTRISTSSQEWGIYDRPAEESPDRSHFSTFGNTPSF